MELINDLKKYIVVVPEKKTNIDNFVFKLQYIGLKWILILCAFISTRNYFGDWINCVTEGDLQNVVNKFCFFTGTYTFKNGTVKGLFSYGAQNEILYHKYYQWVPHFLFLQSLMFMYSGEILWRYYEDNTIYEILKNLRFTDLTVTNKKNKQANRDLEKDKRDKKGKNNKEDSNTKNKKDVSKKSEEIELKKDDYKLDTVESRQVKVVSIAEVLRQRMEYNLNREWSVSLILCEIINCINISIQIYLTNIFIEKRFLTLGFDSSVNLNEAFPLTSKCLFYKYGSSGTIQMHDSLCILSMNILNEKIFYILWFAYFCIAILTVGNIIFRAIQYTFHKNRLFNRFISGPPVHPFDIQWVCELCYSDWLFFKYLSKNLSPAIFQTIIAHLAISRDLQIKLKLNQESEEDNEDEEEENCI